MIHRGTQTERKQAQKSCVVSDALSRADRRATLTLALLPALMLTLAAPSIPTYAAASEATAAQSFADHLLDSSYEFHGRQVESTNYARRRLSMIECFTRADEHNKEIFVASSNLSIAAAAIIIAKALPNPEFSLVFGWGPAWKYIIAGNNQQAGWEEEILVAGKRTKRTNVAQASYLQTAFQIEATRFDVHNRTRRAYVELAAAAAYADLVEDQRSIAQKLLDISQKRFDAGKAPGSEVMQGRLAVMQFDIQRNQAKGRLVQDSAKLAQLLGEIPGGNEIIESEENGLFKLSAVNNGLMPDPRRGVPALEKLLPTAWTQRNDLKAAIQQAYVNRKQVTLAKSQRIPDPSIGFNYMWTNYTQFQNQYFQSFNFNSNFISNVLPNLPADSNGPFSSANANPNPPTAQGSRVPMQPGYQLTFTQEMPILYQYQGQINQAKAQLAMQEKQNDLLRAQIASGIVSAYEALQLTRDNLFRFQQDMLPSSEKVAQLARRGYEMGKTDLATAMLAQQQYQQMRQAYFDAVVAYQNAWADMEQAIGVPLRL